MMKANPPRIFKEVVIDCPRPRKPEDQRLLDLEKKLIQEFFSVLEGTGS
jgi:hypothetical protein